MKNREKEWNTIRNLANFDGIIFDGIIPDGMYSLGIKLFPTEYSL